MRLCFVIPGPPVPTARPRVFIPKGGRFPIATTPPKTREYQERVKRFAAAAVQQEPAWRTFVFSHTKGRLFRLHMHFVIPADRGDLDNFAKVADSLNGVVFADDRQVSQSLFSLLVDKRDEPRTEVLVETCGVVTVPPWMDCAMAAGWTPPAENVS